MGQGIGIGGNLFTYPSKSDIVMKTSLSNKNKKRQGMMTLERQFCRLFGQIRIIVFGRVKEDFVRMVICCLPAKASVPIGHGRHL
jgi:hypothetical protein